MYNSKVSDEYLMLSCKETFFSYFRWLIAYRDALSFRTSHYFVSYIASALLILGGFPLSSSTIVKPLYIEFPRSLVQVVIFWNIPMHYWLKMCMCKIISEFKIILTMIKNFVTKHWRLKLKLIPVSFSRHIPS